MNKQTLTSIADKYEEQVKFEQQHREDLQRQIKELEKQIIDSYNKPIYKLLYKTEYGDYSNFVEVLATELRNRNINI